MTIETLVDLAARLEADQTRPPSELRARDRDVGMRTAALAGQPARRLAAWLDAVSTGGDGTPGRRAAQARRAVLAGLGIAGLLVGSGVAAAVLRYDGTHPVNVLHFLTALVGAQLLLLLGWALLALPGRVAAAVPGVGPVRDLLGLLSPGRLQRPLARLLPQRYRDALARVLGDARAHGRLYGDVDRWLVLQASQTFAVLFNVGALACTLGLVLTSDLAFGWSTTLEVADGALHRVVQALAWPWVALVPDAVPDLNLVAATRYFRLQPVAGGEAARALDPVAAGRWWPFLVASLATWGLLPRLATWAVASLRLRAALRRALLRTPGAAELLDRMDTPLVDGTAPDGEAASPGDAVVADGSAGPNPVAGRPADVVIWGDVPCSDEQAGAWLSERFDVGEVTAHRAGGGRPVEDDAAAARSAGAGAGTVFVLVKAWEPPMLEVVDFLADLRAAAGDGRPVLVVPVQLEGGAPTPPIPLDLRQWTAKVRSVGDPWLGVRTLAGDPAP